MNRKYFAAAAVILAIALTAMWIYAGMGRPQSVFSFADESCAGTVYLTFDDGPSDRVTPKILDVLDEENVKATFFIIGQQAETRGYLVKREFDGGHTVAVHSYTHRYGEIYRSPESLIADIDRCNAVIERITGQRSALYRFPGGSYGISDELISAVTAHGMRYIDWNASTRDAEPGMTDADLLYGAAVSSSSGFNNIVLLSHDSTKKSATPEAIRRLIHYYRGMGFKFGTF